MNPPTYTEQAAYAAIDDALQTFPLAEAPDALLPAIMERIQTIPQIPGFRLTWFDYAISLFGAGMVGAVLLLWQLSGLPSFIQLQTDMLNRMQQPEFLLMWLTLFGGIIFSALALAVATNIFTQRAYYVTVE